MAAKSRIIGPREFIQELAKLCKVDTSCQKIKRIEVDAAYDGAPVVKITYHPAEKPKAESTSIGTLTYDVDVNLSVNGDKVE